MRPKRFRPLTLVVPLALAAALSPSIARGQSAAVLEPALVSRPDSSWDGAVKGAFLGAGAMAGVLGVEYARCDAGCEAPAPGPMFALGMGVGAGGGAAVGWLIDKLHDGKGPAPVAVALRTDPQERSLRVTVPFGAPRLRLASHGAPALRAQATPAGPSPAPARVDDPLTNGALIGAAIGAGAGLGIVGMSYAICIDSDCGPASEGPTWAIGAAAGAGIGLVTGLLIDKARTDAPVAVTVRADRREKAVRLQWRF